MLFVAFWFGFAAASLALTPVETVVTSLFVSFANFPESLSQRHPIIYHRLCRISEVRHYQRSPQRWRVSDYVVSGMFLSTMSCYIYIDHQGAGSKPRTTPTDGQVDDGHELWHEDGVVFRTACRHTILREDVFSR